MIGLVAAHGRLGEISICNLNRALSLTELVCLVITFIILSLVHLALRSLQTQVFRMQITPPVCFVPRKANVERGVPIVAMI
jgi:hypothetical protein